MEPSLLDAVVAEKKAELRTPKKAPKKISADPSAGIDGVEGCLRDFMQRRKSTNLWMLVLPPVSGPAKWNWNTRPQSQWMLDLADLCYEIIMKVAKNSKLLASVVTKAISKLLLYGKATNNTSRSDRDWTQDVGLVIRLVLYWYRKAAEQQSVRDEVLKKLKGDQKIKAWRRLSFVLTIKTRLVYSLKDM